MNFNCYLPHPAAMDRGKRRGFRHHGHFRHGDDEVVGGQAIERIGIARHVRVVPGGFEE